MSNTPTTPASVAARLTDEEILRLAHVEDRYLDHKTAAVLRDYVRMRKLVNGLTYDDCPWLADGGDCPGCPSRLGVRCPFGDQKRLLAESEKGGAE